MPVHQLAADPKPGAADPRETTVEGSGLLGLVEAARVALRRAASVSAESVATGELAGVLESVTAVESVAAALRLELSAEAEARRVADDPAVGGASTGTDAWLAGLLGSTRESQAAGLRLGRLLRDKYHATRQAYAEGRLRPDQVRVIVDAAEHTPDRATAEQRAQAEEWLVGKATGEGNRGGRAMNARRLRQVARRMFERIDLELAMEHELAMLRRDGTHARKETFMSLHDNGDGTWSGKFRIPEMHGHLLDTILGRLTAPRRLARNKDGESVVDPTAESVLGFDEKYGRAWCELIEHLPTTGHGPSAATMLITMDLQSLMEGLGVATTETGIRIEAGEARRLACTAGLVPAVLGSRSEPLDLGRTARLHTTAQRRALALIHDSCAAEGCERPFAWCEVHHPTPWSHGGATDLHNALPLCGHHHRKAHEPGWDLRRHPDGAHRFHRRR